MDKRLIKELEGRLKLVNLEMEKLQKEAALLRSLLRRYAMWGARLPTPRSMSRQSILLSLFIPGEWTTPATITETAEITHPEVFAPGSLASVRALLGTMHGVGWPLDKKQTNQMRGGLQYKLKE